MNPHDCGTNIAGALLSFPDDVYLMVVLITHDIPSHREIEGRCGDEIPDLTFFSSGMSSD
jgi:hypothetical protein